MSLGLQRWTKPLENRVVLLLFARQILHPWSPLGAWQIKDQRSVLPLGVDIRPQPGELDDGREILLQNTPLRRARLRQSHVRDRGNRNDEEHNRAETDEEQ